MDNVYFVDNDYQNVSRDSHFGSSQIRTKPSSFEGIVTRFRNWRISRLSKKLEKKREGLLNDQFNALEENVISKRGMNKLNRKTKAIARLEEKIMILSKMNVPINFRASRAIKLRDKMFANFRMNSNSAYSVGEDKYDQVFTQAPVVDFKPNDGSTMDLSANGYIPPLDNEQPLSHDDIKDVIDSTVGGVNATQMGEVPVETTVDSTSEQGLSHDDIKDVIDSTVDEVKATSMGDVPFDVGTNNNEQELEEDEIKEENTSSEPGTVESDEDRALREADERVQRAINNMLKESNDLSKKEDDSSVISEASTAAEDDHESIQREIDDIFGKIDASLDEGDKQDTDTATEEDGLYDIFTPDENGEEEQASNDDNSVIFEHDNDHPIVSEEWESLSDDEISKAQEDLNTHNIRGTLSEEEINRDFEAYKPVDLSSDSNIRGEAVVTPDRDDSIDYSRADLSDIANNLGDNASLEDFKAARERVEELKRRQKETADARALAEKEAEEAAARAEEVKRIVEERRAILASKMAKLHDYEGALREDCEFNESRAAAAQEAAQASRGIIEEQEAEARGADDLIAEIDSVIEPEAVNVVVKGK